MSVFILFLTMKEGQSSTEIIFKKEKAETECVGAHL